MLRLRFSKFQETGESNLKSEITKLEIDKPQFEAFLDVSVTETKVEILFLELLVNMKLESDLYFEVKVFKSSGNWRKISQKCDYKI
jgi:aminoglycoside phosphotransferase family enzyme